VAKVKKDNDEVVKEHIFLENIEGGKKRYGGHGEKMEYDETGATEKKTNA